MTNEEQSALRAMFREEVNAAVYASEQRLGERLDRVDKRLDRIEQRLDRVDGRLDRVDERLDKLEATTASIGERLHRVEVLQKQMAVSLAQMGSVLDEATIKINELQMSYIALDQKVDDIRRDIQKLTYRADTATEAISGLSLRLNMHRDTPINEAHPHSAA